MENERCYNCLNAKHCINYGKEVCAYEGNTPEEFEAQHCTKDCFVCKHEDSCVASCKGQECSACKFYPKTCKGQ